MKSRKRVWIAAVLASLMGLLGAGRSLGPAKDIPAGTGYSALELCTRTLQSGESVEHVRVRYLEPKVQPLPLLWGIDTRPDAVAVRSVLPTLEHLRTAIHRKGLGCTVITPDTTETAVRAQRFTLVPDLPEDTRAWPLGEGAVESALLSDKASSIFEQHATRLFGEETSELSRAKNTTALLAAQDGKLVFERYVKVTRVSNRSSAGR